MSRNELQTEKVGAISGWVTLETGAEELELSRFAVYEGIRRYEIKTISVGKTLMFQVEDYREAAKRAREEDSARRAQSWAARAGGEQDAG